MIKLVLLITEVRKLNRETVLVDGGKPTSAILVPDEPLYKVHGEKIQAAMNQGRQPLLIASTSIPPSVTARNPGPRS